MGEGGAVSLLPAAVTLGVTQDRTAHRPLPAVPAWGSPGPFQKQLWEMFPWWPSTETSQTT